VRALWVDVAGLAPDPLLAAAPSGPLRAGAMQGALGPLKTLAKGRQVVYLVADDIVEYQAARRRLAEFAAPPGPVIWLRKGNELERLKLLADAWRDIDGAVVAAPVVADAVAKLKVRVFRLPHEGEEADGGS
ncbi:MAG: hypothetical protein NT049_13180, partial [Planctomycetota bacterium]|nr:hypothetical protein [Planctomycetota bacterium]